MSRRTRIGRVVPAPVRRALWNREEARPRTPIRLVLAIAVFLAIAIGTSIAVGALPLPPLGGTAALVIAGAGSLAVTTVGCAVAARFVDRRPLTDYGLRIDREWWTDCGFGLALGAALQTAIFLAGWAAGWYVPRGTLVSRSGEPFLFGVVSVVAFFLAVGIYEELLVRGWLLTNLAEGFRAVGDRLAAALATVLSAGVFGVLHATNPNATALSTGIIGLAGAFLALGYLLTGELAIPIGVHVTWNLVQGAGFGFGVSGVSLPVAAIETRVVGPTVLSGGQFGPEGGLLGLGGVLLGCAAIAWWVHRRTGRLRIHPAVTDPDLRKADSELLTTETGGGERPTANE
ncbi:CPBP family intramembrane glutamic endopeptidase [Halopenitus persicus]|uniref:CPBP family intramembrane glutamic endopeptidase n=1 Tax=Halopenitus persicus TaxID=1048396 RepID=UPI000BBA9953|nr:type II CAAX endopeptidase family protein [Halopenitus persicus]